MFGGRMALRNVGILPHNDTVSQSRRQWLQFSETSASVLFCQIWRKS